MHVVSSEEFLSHRNYLLVLDGVDTAASVELNAEVLGPVNNMFLQWTFNVTDLLRRAVAEHSFAQVRTLSFPFIETLWIHWIHFIIVSLFA